MSPVTDYRFRFEDVEFGLHCPVAPDKDGFDTGTVEVEASEAAARYTNSRNFGRDSWKPADWSWDLHTDTAVTAEEALRDISELLSVWSEAGETTEVGKVFPLYYSVAGRERVVFGRPGSAAEPVLDSIELGLITAQLVFRRADTLHYDAQPRSVVVGLQAAEPIGFTAPFTAPIQTLAGAGRTGVLSNEDVGGDRPAPFRATITAGVQSVVNPSLSGQGWKIQLNKTLAPGDVLEVSTYPWDLGVRLNGASARGLLSLDSRLSKARLRHSGEALYFDGVDSSGTSTCTVQWRPAHRTI